MTTLSRAITLLLLIALSPCSHASVFVSGAYYRLGDDDPGALANATGNDPTRDSFPDALHLARFDNPKYSAFTPPGWPASKLSMAFANESLGGPAIPGHYGRATSLPMGDPALPGYALEAWVATTHGLLGPETGAPGSRLIAYNGDPNANGFGLYESGANYVVRIAATERVLGPAQNGVWHHLAYVQSLGTSSYYYDGQLVASSATDPVPLTATGGFWVGGRHVATDTLDPFNGWIDEVRYQSFNPVAAGLFNPTDFLIQTPEPSALAAGALFLIATSCRRRRRRLSPSPARAK
jgi:hypothetical protein